MTEQRKDVRVPLNTRVSPDARAVIERVAAAERTTASHVARRLLEDAARELQVERRPT